MEKQELLRRLEELTPQYKVYRETILKIKPTDFLQIMGIAQAEKAAKIANEIIEPNKFRESILRTLNPKVQGEELLLNAVLGLTGESGEVADIVKKVKFQGKELDRNHLIEELGDVRYYLELAAYYLNVSMEEIEEKNIEKLKKRYPEGFPSN